MTTLIRHVIIQNLENHIEIRLMKKVINETRPDYNIPCFRTCLRVKYLKGTRYPTFTHFTSIKLQPKMKLFVLIYIRNYNIYFFKYKLIGKLVIRQF